jgi:hypothetical protein
MLTLLLYCASALLLAGCPKQIQQTKQVIQTAQRIQQSLPRPSSAQKSWHVIASGVPLSDDVVLEVINGCPVVAFTENSHLYVAQAQAAVPVASGDWLIHEVEPQQAITNTYDLTQLAGKPVLIYSERESKKNFLAIASIPQPQSEADWQRFDLPDIDLSPSQAAEIDGRLAILTLRRATLEERARKDYSAHRALVFLRQPDADTLDPTQWHTSSISLAENCPGYSVQLLDYAGCPLATYRMGTSAKAGLYLLRAVNADPASATDWVSTFVSSATFGARLGLHAGQPVLAYETGDPPELRLTLAEPEAGGAGFALNTFKLADALLGLNGTDIALASPGGQLCVGWSYYAQVFVFDSDVPAPQSKDHFRSCFMNEAPGKETVANFELAECGSQLSGVYVHDGQPCELRFVAFEN